MVELRRTYLLGVLLIIIGIFIAAHGYLGLQSQNDFRVVNIVKGEDAIRMTKSIHLGNFSIVNAAILDLEGKGQIRVWVAWTNSKEEARNLTEKMAEKVHLYFSEPEIVKIGDIKAYRTYKGSETHYFFSYEDMVIWIQFENPDKGYHMQVIESLILKNGLERYLN
ncbi:hypothetical protein [Geoglobus acetivorans]|uniref:Uncharacterized protein n=1 Tax=Geoglobus acetivorans TaxID=565033 RepID=A0ABZ3H041_GEOAI|nr:hypothetical protein [Geoglobus acetivorans]